MKFERCTNAEFIPKHLLQQLPNKDFDPDGFYDYMKIALTSPTHLLYLLLSEDNEVKGFLWCEVNILEKILYINLLSVEKSLWFGGNMVSLTSEFLHGLFHSLNLVRALWITDRPALFEQLGFKRSKQILLEYTKEEE